MRWVLVLLLAACSEKRPAGEAIAPVLQSGAAEVAARTAPDAALAPPPPPLLVTPPPETGARARLELNLRSTPSGAAVSLDGRLVGTTPLRLEIADDGRAHDFAFVLAGHEPWRLRFAPIKDGVIHATLRARAEGEPDAAVP